MWLDMIRQLTQIAQIMTLVAVNPDSLFPAMEMESGVDPTSA